MRERIRDGTTGGKNCQVSRLLKETLLREPMCGKTFLGCGS